MSLPTPLYIVAAGHRHPERELTSAELEARIPDLREGWCEEYLGIASRRVLGVEERVTELSAGALDDALERANWSGSDLDAIINGCAYTDQIAPPSASYLAAHTNPSALAFDVNAACASFLYALSAGAGLMATTPALQRVAICTGEHSTAWVDFTDRESCVFWGDSGGAMLMTSSRPDTAHFELVDLELQGNSEHPEKVFVPHGGHFRSDGRYSYKTVLALCISTATAVIKRNEVDPSTVVGLAAHQANARVLHDLSDALDIPWERQWHNFEWAGNQSASGVLTAFSAGWADAGDSLVDGDRVVLVSAGGGYAGGAALLEWRS